MPGAGAAGSREEPSQGPGVSVRSTLLELTPSLLRSAAEQAGLGNNWHRPSLPPQLVSVNTELTDFCLNTRGKANRNLYPRPSRPAQAKHQVGACPRRVWPPLGACRFLSLVPSASNSLCCPLPDPDGLIAWHSLGVLAYRAPGLAGGS